MNGNLYQTIFLEEVLIPDSCNGSHNFKRPAESTFVPGLLDKRGPDVRGSVLRIHGLPACCINLALIAAECRLYLPRLLIPGFLLSLTFLMVRPGKVFSAGERHFCEIVPSP